jgi:hypothetical protein
MIGVGFLVAIGPAIAMLALCVLATWAVLSGRFG